MASEPPLWRGVASGALRHRTTPKPATDAAQSAPPPPTPDGSTTDIRPTGPRSMLMTRPLAFGHRSSRPKRTHRGRCSVRAPAHAPFASGPPAPGEGPAQACPSWRLAACHADRFSPDERRHGPRAADAARVDRGCPSQGSRTRERRSGRRSPGPVDNRPPGRGRGVPEGIDCRRGGAARCNRPNRRRQPASRTYDEKLAELGSSTALRPTRHVSSGVTSVVEGPRAPNGTW